RRAVRRVCQDQNQGPSAAAARLIRAEHRATGPAIAPGRRRYLDRDWKREAGVRQGRAEPSRHESREGARSELLPRIIHWEPLPVGAPLWEKIQSNCPARERPGTPWELRRFGQDRARERDER